jgi:hypothetical protein
MPTDHLNPTPANLALRLALQTLDLQQDPTHRSRPNREPRQHPPKPQHKIHQLKLQHPKHSQRAPRPIHPQLGPTPRQHPQQTQQLLYGKHPGKDADPQPARTGSEPIEPYGVSAEQPDYEVFEEVRQGGVGFRGLTRQPF